jgi:N-acetylglutamate synthase-like GNAT family acetyltransferase
MLIFKRPSEMEFRQVKRLLSHEDAPVGGGLVVPEEFTILKKDDRLLACGSLRMQESYGVIEHVATKQDRKSREYTKMIVQKLLETGPPTVWLTTDTPKFFEQFDFVASKQMPKDLARRLEAQYPDSGDRFESMVHTRKKH